MVKAALPPMALELDFRRLETAARRMFNEEERTKIDLVVKALFLTLVQSDPPLTWREWERLPRLSPRRWLECPSSRPSRGPKGRPELAEMIRFFQYHFPGIGKYTTKDDYDESNDKDRTVYVGRFVAFMSELMNQIRRQGAATEGMFPSDIGRTVKDVLERGNRHGRGEGSVDHDRGSVRTMRGNRKDSIRPASHRRHRG